MTIEWRVVDDGKHLVSNTGLYYSNKRKCFLNKHHNGYVKVPFKNKSCGRYIAVWETFVGPIPKGYDVHHKNFVRDDDRLENLECIPKEQHYLKHKIKSNNIVKRILQYSKYGTKLIKEWKSVIDIENKLGYNKYQIIQCCMGNRKRGYGFIWKFKEE